MIAPILGGKIPKALGGSQYCLGLHARCRVRRPAFHLRNERSSAPQKSGLVRDRYVIVEQQSCSRRTLSHHAATAMASRPKSSGGYKRSVASERARYMCAPLSAGLGFGARHARLGRRIANGDILLPVLRLRGPKPDQRLLALAREMRACGEETLARAETFPRRVRPAEDAQPSRSSPGAR